MKVITYVGLTVLSIFVQFTVISFIEGKIKTDKSDSDDHTVSSQEQDEDTPEKPHALYYRSQASSLKENNNPPSMLEYLNISLLHTTTDYSSFSTAVIDELYDENTSLAGTTDVTFTTTEFDNVTEISLFDKKNHTTVKPNIMPKKSIPDDCNCNLLFRVCDINCCCDSDCSDSDLKMFKCGEVASTHIAQDDNVCHSDTSHLYWHYGYKILDMFCIAKTNLPDRRTISREKHDHNVVDKSFKWHSDEKQQYPKEFKRRSYVYGDHVWVLKNGSIRYIDLPIPSFNDYCTDRKPLIFLKEETITCSVKLKDLEMFEIIKVSQEAKLISVLESFSNISTLNCSTLHCTNWTVIVCESGRCVDYNRSLHEPSCTDINCTNLALEFDYIFYFRDFKILNATIKLHIHKVLNLMPYMIQRINVRFIIANENIGHIVRMSGNPGYLDGLPVIVSYSKENHSDTFFNATSSNYIVHPTNNNGMCTNTNDSNYYLTFNTNKRMKCRFQFDKDVSKSNDTSSCKNINNDIMEFFGLYKKVFVSPYGNPQNVNDKDWIPLLTDILDKEPVYGEYNERGSKLHCYNMITHMSYVFTFADTGENNNKKNLKISSAKINLATRNISFNIDDISIVLTIDTMFIDETKPTLYEYAAGPHLNIHLPKDFFFPYPNSGQYNCNFNFVVSIIFSFVLVFQQIK